MSRRKRVFSKPRLTVFGEADATLVCTTDIYGELVTFGGDELRSFFGKLIAAIYARGLTDIDAIIVDFDKTISDRLNKLDELDRKIYDLTRKRADLNRKLRNDVTSDALRAAMKRFRIEYKDPPPPSLCPFTQRDRIPETSAVYFFWSATTIVYVGKAKNLRKRISPAHHRIREGYGLSWLEFPEKRLESWECFYIGFLRPRRNRTGRCRKLKDPADREMQTVFADEECLEAEDEE